MESKWLEYDVKSSRISKIEFQALKTVVIKGIKVPVGNMRVTFTNNGMRYLYYNIPKTLVDALVSAESVGKTFQALIISNRGIKYEKLKD